MQSAKGIASNPRRSRQREVFFSKVLGVALQTKPKFTNLISRLQTTSKIVSKPKKEKNSLQNASKMNICALYISEKLAVNSEQFLFTAHCSLLTEFRG